MTSKGILRLSERRICEAPSCENPKIVARGFCDTHYRRWKRGGDLSTPIRKIYPSPEEAFSARTEWQGGCLIWTGGTTSGGYGKLGVKGRTVSAHRYAWERKYGPILGDLEIDHMCYNRLCMNVEHLRLVTRKENARNLSGGHIGSDSGVRNVTRRGDRWMVRVGRNYVGTFSDIETAEKVAEKARDSLFKEFAGRG